MAKNIKKSLCVLLTVTMIATLFIGCGKKSSSNTTTGQELVAMDDTKSVELTYFYWEDEYIVDSLVEGWNSVHPNATVTTHMTTTSTNNQDIINLASSNSVPDVFWIVGTPENFIKQGLLYDMSVMWDADSDAQNVIGGVNDFELGKFGTSGKWTTPVKFFPTVMFLNLTTFQTLNHDMPSYDWTWEEFEDVVKDMSTQYNGKQYFGISEACTVITLYPIANDPDCIGEFGWDGTSFDLTDWADGLDLEKEFIDRKYKSPVPGGTSYGSDDDYLVQLYGESLFTQDKGYAAIRTDHWWCWERYWNDYSFYSNNTYFVPYTMPHTEENQSSTNMFATIDFGAISSATTNPLESYYLLKYMTWGADGWNWKLDHREEIRNTAIVANGGNPDEFWSGNADATDGGEVINNCPITKDTEVWNKYKLLHPNAETGDDIADRLEAVNVDPNARIEAFEAFWENVLAGKWTCYGSQQIPGFDSWLTSTYQKGEDFAAGATGVEDAVIHYNAGSASQFVQTLTDSANESAAEYKAILDEMIQKTGGSTN
jgi:multiple sugar transport system substrate-binding protein